LTERIEVGINCPERNPKVSFVIRLSVAAGALLSGAVLLPAVAATQPVQGLYVSLGAGTNLAGNLFSEQEPTKIYTTVGPAGLAGLGWGFCNGLRMEIEGSYRSNSVSGISTRRGNGLLEPLSNVTGNAATDAVMANLAYDVPVHAFGLQPYVGAGVGYGWPNLENVHGNGLGNLMVPGNTLILTPDLVTFDTAGALAYQAMIGTSLPLPGVPGLSATLEYRFFGMADVDIPVDRLSTETNATYGGVLPSTSVRNKFVTADHAILIGLRYSFGHALAPLPTVAEPMAAPAAAPARSYLVFFD
jgi:OOP family OmpA-OmpF porin